MPKEAGVYWNKVLTRKFLMKSYRKNDMTVGQIAEQVGCSQMTVDIYLHKLGIKVRNRSEAGKRSRKGK